MCSSMCALPHQAPLSTATPHHPPPPPRTRANAGTSKGVVPMLDETRVMLESFYKPYNEKLCSLELAPVGCNTTWLQQYQRS